MYEFWLLFTALVSLSFCHVQYEVSLVMYNRKYSSMRLYTRHNYNTDAFTPYKLRHLLSIAHFRGHLNRCTRICTYLSSECLKTGPHASHFRSPSRGTVARMSLPQNMARLTPTTLLTLGETSGREAQVTSATIKPIQHLSSKSLCYVYSKMKADFLLCLKCVVSYKLWII